MAADAVGEEGPWGPSINDVTQLFHIFYPSPLVIFPITQPISTIIMFWTTPPPPLVRDVIYGWSLRSSEGVGPDIDEKEEEERGASGDQAQSSHNSSDVWDIPGDPWATRGDGLVMFCPRNTK